MGSKIGTKRCMEQPKLVGLFWQSCGHQQNWYEKTLEAAKVRISYFGNLMVTITTDTKISLEHSKVLMDYIGNLQVTSKIGTTTVLIGYFGNLMVTITNDMKISLGHVQFLWIILVIFRSPTKSVFVVEILWSPSQPV